MKKILNFLSKPIVWIIGLIIILIGSLAAWLFKKE